MSKFDDWYHGPEGVKQVVGYKSAKIAWDYQQKSIDDLEAQVAEGEAKNEGLYWENQELKAQVAELEKRPQQIDMSSCESRVRELEDALEDGAGQVLIEHQGHEIGKLHSQIDRLKEQVAALEAENRLLLTAHKAGEKISRDSDDQSWKNWVDACRKVEAALKDGS